MAVVAQVVVDVVLDGDDVVGDQHVGDLPAAGVWHGGAGGVGEGGAQVDQPHPVLAQGGVQCGRHDAVRVGLDRDQVDALGPHGLYGRGVGGPFHQHGVARIDQHHAQVV